MSVPPAIAALSIEQLRHALDRVGRANDMLPPREDDKVAGRIAGRFVEGLHARIAAGEYKCAPATIVPVPKRAYTTRPAAVATLQDRVVYEALVDAARPKIAKFLTSDETVIAPRADDGPPDWNKFERAPLARGGGWIVSADVAGCYESVDHGRLKLVLADAGIPSEARESIALHLGHLMGGSRGLPQGVETSDALATLYLAPVDHWLQLEGVAFWRHGDDYRLWAPSYPRALAAVFELEQALRRSALMLNSGKLTVERFAIYAKTLEDVDEASGRFHKRLRDAREAALHEATEEQLAAAIEAAGIDEDMQWRFWYNQTLDMDEMIAALAPSLTPKPIEVVTEMLNDLMSTNPTKRLTPKLSHARLTFCIRRLARAKSPAALPWLGRLLVSRPDEVQDLANYMLAIIDKEPDKIIAACQYALTNKGHMLDWERAWIYRVLSRGAGLVHRTVLREARQVAESDASNWLARIEATRLLAKARCLTQETTRQVTKTAPDAFRGDIAGIIAMIEEPGEWTAAYLDGARQDPLAAVIIDGVRTKVRQQAI